MRQLSGDLIGLTHALSDAPPGVARDELAILMGVDDRRMRRAVEEARRRGILVIHDGEVYRLARSLEDYRAWRDHSLRSRLGAFGEQLRAMERTAAMQFAGVHQPRLFQPPSVPLLENATGGTR